MTQKRFSWVRMHPLNFIVMSEIDLGLIGSGFGSIVNGISNYFSTKQANKTNVQLARETNALQHQMQQENNMFQLNAMREQNQFNKDAAIEMFNLENEYNSPVNQIQRLREAGINPAVALGGSATSVANTGDAMTPTAGGSGVSSSLPTLTTPQVQAMPPISKGFLDALKTFSEVSLNRSQKGKTDAETNRITTLVDGELKKLLADSNYSEAQTRYVNLQRSLDQLFAPFERDIKIKEVGEHIKQLSADAALSAIKGDTEKAQKFYYEAETALSKIQKKSIKEKLPLELLQLRGLIRLTNEQARTEKTKQNVNISSAGYNRAMAKLYNIKGDLEDKKRDWLTSRDTNEYGFPTESNLEKLFTADLRQKLKNLSKTDKETEKLSKEIENLFLMARKNSKDLDWYEVDKVFKMSMEFYKNNIDLIDGLVPF